MVWFTFKDNNEEEMLVNADAIMSVTYYKDTDLVRIEFIRSAYNGTFIKGRQAFEDIKKAMNFRERAVIRIGETK